MTQLLDRTIILDGEVSHVIRGALVYCAYNNAVAVCNGETCPVCGADLTAPGEDESVTEEQAEYERLEYERDMQVRY